MQQYVHQNLQFVQMDASRLDRLTALLEGLSPKVSLTSKADGLSLHIIKTGTTERSSDSVSVSQLDGLSLLVCPEAYSIQNFLEADQQCFMSFDVCF